MMVILDIDDSMPFSDAELMLNCIKESSQGYITQARIVHSTRDRTTILRAK